MPTRRRWRRRCVRSFALRACMGWREKGKRRANQTCAAAYPSPSHRHRPIFLPPARLSQAGAAALVVLDDGSCGEDFSCGGWLGSKASGADLAAKDDPVRPRRGRQEKEERAAARGQPAYSASCASKPPASFPFSRPSPPFPSQGAWSGVRIPSVLVTESQGQRLLRLMKQDEVAIEGLGTQKYTPPP